MDLYMELLFILYEKITRIKEIVSIRRYQNPLVTCLMEVVGRKWLCTVNRVCDKKLKERF